MRKSSRPLFIFLIFLISIVSFSSAQQKKGKVKILSIESYPELDLMKKLALNVYMDCKTCDKDFIKKEITFVNYVRDRKDSDVHILITLQMTGSGGKEHTVSFIGQNKYSDLKDILIYTSRKMDTDDDIRRGLTRVLKLGLIPFVYKTPIADKISVYFKEEVEPTAVEDKWNFWVFNIGINGNTTGEKTTRFTSYNGNFSINRVTLKSKIRLGFSANFNENRYKFDEEIFTSTSRSERFRSLYVKSLGDHWSVGVLANINSSSYSNTKLDFYGGLGIEYSIFPYSESTRKLVSLLYEAGYNYSNYREETIFDKMSEHLFGQSLTVTADFKQPWGYIFLLLEGSHYFHDFSKNRLDLETGLSINLFKGFSFEVWGGYSQIHDQLSLPKRGATYEEVLLRRKELSTNYSYHLSVGLSYTFGSIYSNVVNPRFGR
jgi:hypothetical protein